MEHPSFVPDLQESSSNHANNASQPTNSNLNTPSSQPSNMNSYLYQHTAPYPQLVHQHGTNSALPPLPHHQIFSNAQNMLMPLGFYNIHPIQNIYAPHQVNLDNPSLPHSSTMMIQPTATQSVPTHSLPYGTYATSLTNNSAPHSFRGLQPPQEGQAHIQHAEYHQAQLHPVQTANSGITPHLHPQSLQTILVPTMVAQGFHPILPSTTPLPAPTSVTSYPNRRYKLPGHMHQSMPHPQPNANATYVAAPPQSFNPSSYDLPQPYTIQSPSVSTSQQAPVEPRSSPRGPIEYTPIPYLVQPTADSNGNQAVPVFRHRLSRSPAVPHPLPENPRNAPFRYRPVSKKDADTRPPFSQRHTLPLSGTLSAGQSSSDKHYHVHQSNDSPIQYSSSAPVNPPESTNPLPLTVHSTGPNMYIDSDANKPILPASLLVEETRNVNTVQATSHSNTDCKPDKLNDGDEDSRLPFTGSVHPLPRSTFKLGSQANPNAAPSPNIFSATVDSGSQSRFEKQSAPGHSVHPTSSHSSTLRDKTSPTAHTSFEPSASQHEATGLETLVAAIREVGPSGQSRPVGVTDFANISADSASQLDSMNPDSNVPDAATPDHDTGRSTSVHKKSVPLNASRHLANGNASVARLAPDVTEQDQHPSVDADMKSAGLSFAPPVSQQDQQPPTGSVVRSAESILAPLTNELLPERSTAIRVSSPNGEPTLQREKREQESLLRSSDQKDDETVPGKQGGKSITLLAKNYSSMRSASGIAASFQKAASLETGNLSDATLGRFGTTIQLDTTNKNVTNDLPSRQGSPGIGSETLKKRTRSNRRRNHSARASRLVDVNMLLFSRGTVATEAENSLTKVAPSSPAPDRQPKSEEKQSISVDDTPLTASATNSFLPEANAVKSSSSVDLALNDENRSADPVPSEKPPSSWMHHLPKPSVDPTTSHERYLTDGAVGQVSANKGLRTDSFGPTLNEDAPGSPTTCSNSLNAPKVIRTKVSMRKKFEEPNQVIHDVGKPLSSKLKPMRNSTKAPQLGPGKLPMSKSLSFLTENAPVLAVLPEQTPRCLAGSAALPDGKTENPTSPIPFAMKLENGRESTSSTFNACGSKASGVNGIDTKEIFSAHVVKDTREPTPSISRNTSDAPAMKCESGNYVKRGTGVDLDVSVFEKKPFGTHSMDSLNDQLNKVQVGDESLHAGSKLYLEGELNHCRESGSNDGQSKTLTAVPIVCDRGVETKDHDMCEKSGLAENLEIETYSSSKGRIRSVRRSKERSGIYGGAGSHSDDIALLNPPVLSALPTSSPAKPVAEIDNSSPNPSASQKSLPSMEQSPDVENKVAQGIRASTRSNLRGSETSKLRKKVIVTQDQRPPNESINENIGEAVTTLSQKVKLDGDLRGRQIASNNGIEPLKSVLRSSQLSVPHINLPKNEALGEGEVVPASKTMTHGSLVGRRKPKKVRFSIEEEASAVKSNGAVLSGNPAYRSPQADQNGLSRMCGERGHLNQERSNLASSPKSALLPCAAADKKDDEPKKFFLPLTLRLHNGKEAHPESNDSASDEGGGNAIDKEFITEREVLLTKQIVKDSDAPLPPSRLSVLDSSAFSVGPAPSFALPSVYSFTSPCTLCGTALKDGNIFTHPLFPTRLVKICGACRDTVSKKTMKNDNARFAPNSSKLALEKAAIFVAVVEQMVISMKPSEASLRGAVDAVNTLKSRKPEDFMNRISALSIPYDMVAIACKVLDKTGLAIDDGRVRWTKQLIEVKCDDCAECVMSLWPATVEDMMCGTCRGERAWARSFPDVLLEKGTRSCVVLEKILTLIGIEVRSKHCTHKDNNGVCKMILDLGSVMKMTHGAAGIAKEVGIKALFADNWEKKDALRMLNAEDFAVLVEKEDISGEMDGCCICGSAHDATNFPLRFAECGQCWRRFCSCCIVHVIGAIEYTQVMCGTDYKCPLCRLRGNRHLKMRDMEDTTEPRVQSVSRKELDSGRRIRKKRETRKIPGILHLSPMVRRELLLHGFENYSYPIAVGVAKTWELVNDQMLAGNRNLNREEYEKICLKCRSLCEGHEDKMEDIDKMEETIECGVMACGNFTHIKCAVEGTVTQGRRRGNRGKWTCGQHQCQECEQKDESKLVKCLTCPTALCMDHMGGMDELYIVNDRSIICQECQKYIAKPKKFTANGSGAGGTGGARRSDTGRRMNASLKSRMQVALAIETGQRAGMLRNVMNDNQK